jgi:predicted membrane protein
MIQIMMQIIVQTIDMTEFWGLVLFATFIALAAAFAVALLYCGGIVLCEYCKRRNQPPLASAENQV